MVPRTDRRPSRLNTAREGLQARPCDAQHCRRGRPAPQQPVSSEGCRDGAPTERPIAMPGDVAKLAEAIDPKYRAMVLLAAYCSLRFGELAGLRRSRVDLLHRTVTVEENAVEVAGRVTFGPPKTAAGRRVVAIPAELVEILDTHLSGNVDVASDALVFPDLEGNPLGRNKFRPLWAAACAGAGISGLHFHDLRGSGATWAATAGATLRELMVRLGHTTPTVAMRYQHATHERDRAIADKLGGLLRAVALQSEPTASVAARPYSFSRQKPQADQVV